MGLRKTMEKGVFSLNTEWVVWSPMETKKLDPGRGCWNDVVKRQRRMCLWVFTGKSSLAET